MADRLFDIANSTARRLGDMFGLAPGASLDRPELYPGDQPRPDLLGAPATSGDRPNFFGGGQAGRPDFFGNAAGSARPDFYSQPAGFSFWDYAAQHQAATNPSTIQGQGVPLGAGVAVGAGIATAGLKPGVAQWASQTQQTFGDLGGWVPAAMLAIIQHESEGSPTAYNGASAGGAWGLFQQMGLGSNDPNTQFSAARQLAQEKLAMVNAAYAKLGINPDDRTRARDLFLAWAGHFDPATAGPSATSRDQGSGEDANAFLNGPRGIMPMYDGIVAGQHAAAGPGRQSAGDAIARAQGLIGTPYQLGGLRTHPGVPNAGLDCSELTGYALGLDASMWNAQAQYDHAQKLDPSQAQAGDLVFFSGTDPSNNQPITHVGLYLGNGQMIDAEDGGVLVANLNSQYWQSHLAGYGRL